jgi:hypothetical protein
MSQTRRTLRVAHPGVTANRLAAWNRTRFDPGSSESHDAAFTRAELTFAEGEVDQIRELARSAPRDVDGFLRWFSSLEETGAGQHDPFFDWLAGAATLEQVRWFLCQEVAGEAGFDDLVALTQVRLPTRAKLELARNYWDEMGQGLESAMHGPMLSLLTRELKLDPHAGEVVWEAHALSNLMIAFATHRCHAYRSIGALGVIELTAPWRASKVNEALRRLGLPGHTRRYYALHATLDIKHSEAWNREVIGPLVADRSDVSVPIAEGALARLAAGARCFDRYKSVLWADG